MRIRKNPAVSFSIPAHIAESRLDTGTTNRVLRNTYLLLAITLIPTAIGAGLGLVFPIIQAGMAVYLIAFFAGMFGLQYMVVRNRDSGAGVAWLLLFTLFMGYFIAPLIGIALSSYSNGASLVATAAGGTAAIFFALSAYASTTSRDFSSPSIGKMLFIGMWMLFIISIVNIFFLNSVVAMAVSSLFIVVASGLIMFTINRVVRGGEENYIMATMTIYIMLINLFQSILHLLLAFAGNRE